MIKLLWNHSRTVMVSLMIYQVHITCGAHMHSVTGKFNSNESLSHNYRHLKIAQKKFSVIKANPIMLSIEIY